MFIRIQREIIRFYLKVFKILLNLVVMLFIISCGHALMQRGVAGIEAALELNDISTCVKFFMIGVLGVLMFIASLAYAVVIANSIRSKNDTMQNGG